MKQNTKNQTHKNCSREERQTYQQYINHLVSYFEVDSFSKRAWTFFIPAVLEPGSIST